MQEWAVALVGVFIGFFVGRVDNYLNVRFDAYRAKVEKFYQPLYVLHIKATRGCAFDFFDLPEDSKIAICQHVIEKSMFADKDLQDYLSEFMWYATDAEKGIISQADILHLNNCYRIILDRAFDERAEALTRLLEPTYLDLFQVAFKRSINRKDKNSFDQHSKRDKDDGGDDKKPHHNFFPWEH